MKTHPSQRHFAVPVAIVASAHVIPFLGFRAPPKPITPPPEKPNVVWQTPPPVEVTIVETTEPIDTTTSKASATGQAVPDIVETLLPSHSSDIFVPLEPQTVGKVDIRHSAIPTSLGNGRDGKIGLQIANVTDLDFSPRTVSQLSPIYPASLRAQGVSGNVTVTFVVDTAGHVHDVSVVNASHPEFIEPALRAVAHWRFEPGKHHGRPVSFRMSVPLNFVLGD